MIVVPRAAPVETADSDILVLVALIFITEINQPEKFLTLQLVLATPAPVGKVAALIRLEVTFTVVVV